MKIADAAVLIRDGKVLISDGQFAETREQIGGHCLIDRTESGGRIGLRQQVKPGSTEVRL
jgi:hypothetical protein